MREIWKRNLAEGVQEETDIVRRVADEFLAYAQALQKDAAVTAE